MASLIQILKFNEPRTGVGKTGKPWLMQEVEVLVLNDDGSVESAGGFMLPRDMTGDKLPPLGVYQCSFALNVDYKTRQVEAVITALVPYPMPVGSKPALSGKAAA